MNDSLIIPHWPAPANIKALTTTRRGGCSQAPFDSFNLGLHVGDNTIDVLANRCRLQKMAQLPDRPKWLQQVHGDQVVDAAVLGEPVAADASFSTKASTVCVVMTADCLPIILCNKQGSFVAAIHAGWRSLANGIIENTVTKYCDNSNDLLAWLGPCIGPKHFEVGTEVREQFINNDEKASVAFKAQQDKWLADLQLLAQQRLQDLGIQAIYHHQACTFSDPSEYFSYRREGNTGRMATMIWIAE